jgi:hypothetical protein
VTITGASTPAPDGILAQVVPRRTPSEHQPKGLIRHREDSNVRLVRPGGVEEDFQHRPSGLQDGESVSGRTDHSTAIQLRNVETPSIRANVRLAKLEYTL